MDVTQLTIQPQILLVPSGGIEQIWQNPTQLWQAIVPKLSNKLSDQDLATAQLIPLVLQDAAAPLKIDQVRQLQQNLSFAPRPRELRLVLLSLSGAAAVTQNALLKILEEPPPQTLIILGCQALNQCLPTIQSRCLILNFSHEEIESLRNRADHSLSDLPKPDLKPIISALFDKTVVGIIDICNQYAKREDARAVVELLITDFPAEFAKQRGALLQLLLAAHHELEHTINAQLCLEHYFFQIHKRLTVLDED